MTRSRSLFITVNLLATIVANSLIVTLCLPFVDPQYAAAKPHVKHLLDGPLSIVVMVLLPVCMLLSLITSIGILCKTPARKVFKAWIAALVGLIALATSINIFAAKIWFALGDSQFLKLSSIYAGYFVIHFLVYLAGVIIKSRSNRKSLNVQSEKIGGGRKLKKIYQLVGVCIVGGLFLIANNYRFHYQLLKAEKLVWNNELEQALPRINNLIYSPTRFLLPFETQARVVGLEADQLYHVNQFETAQRYYEFERFLLNFGGKYLAQNRVLRMDDSYWENLDWEMHLGPVPYRAEFDDSDIEEFDWLESRDNLLSKLDAVHFKREELLHQFLISEPTQWRNKIDFLVSLTRERQAEIKKCQDLFNLGLPYCCDNSRHNFNQPLMHVHANALVMAYSKDEQAFLTSSEALLSGLKSLNHDGTFASIVFSINCRIAFTQQVDAMIEEGLFSTDTENRIKQLISSYRIDDQMLINFTNRLYFKGKQFARINVLTTFAKSPEYRDNPNLKSFWLYQCDQTNYSNRQDLLAFFTGDTADFDFKTTSQLTADEFKSSRPNIYHWLRDDLDCETALKSIWNQHLDIQSQIFVSHSYPFDKIKERYDLAVQLEEELVSGKRGDDLVLQQR